MIDFLKTEWKLLRLKRADKRLEKAFRRERSEAQNTKAGHARIEELYQQEMCERSMYIDEIAQINTRKLYQEAGRYDVFVSQDEDWWEPCRVIRGRHLSTKGFNELRSAIRKEKNERWAYWELRLKVLGSFATALTGAAGALIGLFAILKK